ncbi:hypothetical protein ACFCYX_03855 [Streptomyces populi]|uniref:hypothetical protein n=1 Tax=Streptomyces populi TaxID=2058924 RepID=UPI0013A6938F|nr:hypothetical protein [Streptomyces populi]
MRTIADLLFAGTRRAVRIVRHRVHRETGRTSLKTVHAVTSSSAWRPPASRRPGTA